MATAYSIEEGNASKRDMVLVISLMKKGGKMNGHLS